MYEKDPNHGFLFPVKFIEEKYGESSRVPEDTSDSESSSDSSDDESSGSRGKPQATDESESAEEVRAERLRKAVDEMRTLTIIGWSMMTEWYVFA